MIVVEDLVVKYSPELPAVLHGVSFNLKARERVGLLGRTGSGKSTLAMSILRFVGFPTCSASMTLLTAEQVDPTRGRIMIDGIDISTIGLYDLRSRLVRLLVFACNVPLFLLTACAFRHLSLK